MDRTGPDHDEQAPVGETENFEDLLTRLVNEAGGGIADGAFRFKGKWRVHDVGGPDTEIINDVLHGDDRVGMVNVLLIVSGRGAQTDRDRLGFRS